ncbi:MAG: hypothetical protein V7637_3742 [Mycobacteriales bacterium]
MPDTLKAGLLDTDRRGQVVTDLQALVDQEVAGKGGLSGGIIKAGYAAVKKVRPGIIRGAIDSMFEEFVAALEPHWAAYRAQPAPGFGAFLATRPHEVSEALLAVTDRRAARATRAAITSVYGKLRPRGQDNVIEALPRLGDLVERHAR